MKLIVLSLLLGGIASANGGTCKAKKLREGFEHLQSQGGEILDDGKRAGARVIPSTENTNLEVNERERRRET